MNKKAEIKNRIDLINRGEVPEGYKKVHGYIIPTDWQITRFNKIFERITKKNDVGCENVLTISAQYGLINQQEFFKKSIASADTSNYFLLNKNDFAYNKSYSAGYPFGTIKKMKLYEQGIVSPLYICFRAKPKLMNIDYIEQYFDANKFNSEILAIAQEGARNHGLLNMSIDDFFNCNIVKPSQQEQEKIAKILNCCDKVIELKQKLLKEKIREKKYYILNIFKNNICKQFTEYSLGEICNITTGKLDANAQCKNGKYRFYTCAAEYSYINTYAFDTEALLISGNGAHVGYIHYYKGKFNAYQRTYVLDNFKGNIFFIKYQLDKFLKKHINKEKNAGNTPYIILSTLMNVKIYLSKDKTLEDNIVKMFLLIDQQIDYLKQELDQFKQLKKSLSQLLLTGIVRTVEVDCEN